MLDNSFQSVGHFRSILESYSYETFEENGYLNMKKGRGMLFTVPFGDIISRFTLDDLEERKKRTAQIRAWLTLFKYGDDHFILNFKANVIVNARDGGVGEGLLERPGKARGDDDSRAEGGSLATGVDLGLDGLLPEHPVDAVANAVDNILSVGGNGTGGVGCGGRKDLSKKRKRRKDDREGGGMGY